MAKRLRRTVEELEIPHKDSLAGVVTISAGIAALTEPGKTPGDLLKEADTALYRAKESGRNRVASYGEAP